MLNRIWFWLLFIGILYGFGKAAIGPLEPPSNAPVATVGGEAASPDVVTNDAVPTAATSLSRHEVLRDAGQNLTEASLGAAETSVKLCITLIGIMALWLGMLNIAKDAGMVDALANMLRPAIRWLFPDVPNGHPAQGAMLMNIAANMLGLGNAATPFGLKAMRELQTLNPTKDTATNAMATFLAINTSNVTLIPITIIGLRVAAGSNEVVTPLVPILLTTTVTTVVAIFAVRVLSKLPSYAMPAEQSNESSDTTPDPTEAQS